MCVHTFLRQFNHSSQCLLEAVSPHHEGFTCLECPPLLATSNSSLLWLSRSLCLALQVGNNSLQLLLKNGALLDQGVIHKVRERKLMLFAGKHGSEEIFQHLAENPRKREQGNKEEREWGGGRKRGARGKEKEREGKENERKRVRKREGEGGRGREREGEGGERREGGREGEGGGRREGGRKR